MDRCTSGILPETGPACYFHQVGELHLLALYDLLKCKAAMEATLSSKNQIVIPREAWKGLDVKPGDKLLIVPRGNTVIVMAKPDNYAEALLGLGKDCTRKAIWKRSEIAGNNASSKLFTKTSADCS